MSKVWQRTWITAAGEEKSAWVCDYFSPDKDGKRKRHIKTFERKKDASDHLAKVMVEIGKGVHTAPNKSIKVAVLEDGKIAASAAKDWLDYVEGEGRERTTLEQYEQHVRLHIAPRIGHLTLAQLTAPMVEDFRDALVKDLSRPMARKVLGSLKMLLRRARVKGKVAQNVAADTTIGSHKRD